MTVTVVQPSGTSGSGRSPTTSPLSGSSGENDSAYTANMLATLSTARSRHHRPVGIATEVWRSVRYDGSSGCAHELLLQAGRPSASNADQGALDAADAFADSALDHLQAWFAAWRLPSLCRDQHEAVVVGRSEEPCDMEGPGFGWVEVWRTLEDDWMTLSTEPLEGAVRVTAYLLRGAGGDGDL